MFKRGILFLGLILLLTTMIGCSLKNSVENDNRFAQDALEYNNLSNRINGQNGNIALITNSEDSDLFLAIKLGLQRIEKRMPCVTTCLCYENDDEFEDMVKRAVKKDNSLIWVVGKAAKDIKEIAKKNEKTIFAVINNESEEVQDNIFNVEFRESETGFFAGYLARLESKKGMVGMICDKDSKKDICSFKAGVAYGDKELNKKSKIKIIEVSSDDKEDKVKENIAKAYKEGTDIMYVEKKDMNEQVMKVAKEKKGYVIAFEDKENDLVKKTLLGNITYGIDSAIELASFRIMKNAKLVSNSYEYGFSEGALDIKICSDNVKKVTSISKLNALKETILADSINIPQNEKELKDFMNKINKR